MLGKKLVPLAALVALMSSVSLTQAAQQVTIYGDNAYPPYSYKEGGEERGIYTAILKEAFAKMGDYEVTIEMVPWKRALSSIEKGDGFALYPPYHRPSLRPWITPYSEPILDETTVVYCREAVIAERAPKSFPDDYKGLVFVNNTGYASGGDAFMALVEAGEIKMQEAKSTQLNLKKMLLGRGDCFINDRLNILSEMKKLEAAGEVKADSEKLAEAATLTVEKGYLGFSGPGAANFPFMGDFLAKFNAIIKEMHASGRIDAIIAEQTGG
ncbi:substrate-binding periplasmic protein [Aestuariispira insulae]|uniref:Amino acid ABC transporter substrate-binding protein (PAAT family) n=1 Tax=Aestuariispira insulae TaxID=1461337 RepID=A0A3D9HHY9_9PROT|nr:transporter substrate-binding domain-containing protein [Aestuariispira insulae]RED48576.1 amino acid ABC transporter substrate-binding protein (PAAT family) [Aestuariispira insulae]